MDHRTALGPGYELRLGAAAFRIGTCLGRGANSLAYRAVYEDAALPGQLHQVLIKELFPWRPEGGIVRDASGAIRCEPEAGTFFSLHKESFLRGNRVHLELQRTRADKVPPNWNTYPANGTLYTVSGDSGGRTLWEFLQTGEPLSLEAASCWMRNLLYSLRAFHERGLLHLDISPDNILLQPLDRGKPESAREVLLIDYNSAWSREELVCREELFLSLKEPYASPEVRLRVLESVGAPADLYSVCVVFLTCLLGAPPAQESLERRLPPLRDAPALRDAPDTAFHQALSILRRGLKAPPGRRFQTVNEAIAAFSELLARIEGGGVTHAALWEASAREFQAARARMPAGAGLEELTAAKGEEMRELRTAGSCVLTGGGGAGKTSMLLGLWMEGTRTYDPRSPVPVYLPLYAYDGGKDYLRRTLLGLLRLSPGERRGTAGCALTRFLNGPARGIWLLLDGVDEAVGDIQPLFREIRALGRRPGVEIIAASRHMVPELGLPERPVPPLTDGEIADYLARRGLLPPREAGVREMLRTPVLLAMYGRLRSGAGKPETGDEESLLAAYLDGLAAACRENAGEDAGYRGEFAVHVLLPFLADGMKDRSRLSSDAVFRRVERCFALLGKKSFRKAFPRYVGRAGVLRGGAADAEAWFALMVRDLLERRFALLWQDGEGDYHLFHQYFQPLLAKRWARQRSGLRRARLSVCTLPLSAAALCAVLAWGWARQAPLSGAYPRTAQERQTADLAVNELVVACGLLDDQYQAERDILDAVGEGLYAGETEAWETWLRYRERRLVSVQTLEMDRHLLGELPERLADAPVPLDAVERIYSLPGTYCEELYRRIDALERCLAPDSGYSERARRQVVELLLLLLESETAESFLLIGEVVSSLDRDTAALIMEFLSCAGSWRAQLRQADWEGTDYALGLSACRAEQKDLRLELSSLGISL